MRCTVCSRIGSARLMLLGSGARIGPFCPGECEGLGWEAHFVRETGGDAYDMALVQWRWRQHLATLEGRVFLDPPPKSPAEMSLERTIAANGWGAAARELS